MFTRSERRNSRDYNDGLSDAVSDGKSSISTPKNDAKPGQRGDPKSSANRGKTDWTPFLETRVAIRFFSDV